MTKTPSATGSKVEEPGSSGTLDQRISDAELALQRAQEELTRLRAERPAEEVKDYTLTGPGGAELSLGEMFGERDDLIVVHNMGRSCAYCTLWADEFNGVLPHLMDRTRFVVTSPDLPDEQVAFAEERGWKFPMYSVDGTSFAADMGFHTQEGPYPGYQPGVSSFHKRADGGIERVAHATFGPGDTYCGFWHYLDLLKDREDGWSPKFKY